MNLSLLGTALNFIFNGVSGHAASMAAAMAIDALWQGVLVAGALALFMHFAPRVSAAHRFAVWSAAFAALVVLSLISLLPEFSSSVATAVAAHPAEQTARPWFSVDARWSLVIAALWLAASLYRAAGLALHSLRLRKLWKDAEPVELDERVAGLVADAVAGCSRGPVEVCTTKALQRPSVIGFFKPRILVPDWLFARITQGELEQIVLHEAEHLRRRDDWTNLAQKICLVLFPLNPALVWIERRLCREREMACDDGVIRITRAPRAYAACLTSLAERGLERSVEALSLGVWQRRPELVHRVHSILHGKGVLSPVGTRVLLGMLGCGLLAGSVELAHSPQLVAFVPEHYEAATKSAGHTVTARTASQVPVQIAAVAGLKSNANASRVISSRSPKNSERVFATNVTLRQPSQAQVINLEASHAKKDEQNAPQAMAKRADQVDHIDAKVNTNANVKAVPESQWVVLTTWEQVETMYASSGAIADYDTVIPTEGSPGFVTPSRIPFGQMPGGQITVTQLIFRVLPANANFGTAAKQAARPSTSQPGVATFRDGWLVIQL
jgi:beta-lactamase regulating signal transducer with metallopeptidase domain